MDQKTEKLREIFMDVSDEGTVTERQEESPGSLAGEDAVEERIADLIDRMRERYEFAISFTNDELATVARGFYDDAADEAIAEDLDTTTEEVRRARLDLHLLKESDRDAPFDFHALRRAIADSDADPAAEVQADTATIDRARTVVAAEQAMRQANYRFRDQFDDILGDGDVAEHLTREITDDGLEGATEGLEVDTGF